MAKAITISGTAEQISKAKGGQPRDADSRTLADQKKFIGNSVHPLVPKFWAEAMNAKIIECQKKSA